MYLGKVAEYQIRQKILEPFKTYCGSEGISGNGKFRDIEIFLDGGHSPSIVGFARFLKWVRKPVTDEDDPLVLAFRHWWTSFSGINSTERILIDKKFLKRLNSFGEVRNKAAHIGDPDTHELWSKVSVVIDNDRPGILFDALGITFKY